MSLQHFGKGALRVAKNYTKGYSDVQAKVRDATSNDPWGPSGTQMNEIAQMTYNQNDFVEIMEMLDKRLNDKGKNWRHVFKSLTLLDYCLHAGSENVVIYFRDNIYVIKTLKEFQYLDEYGKDQGANVRQKAKDITNLLSDETRLREERRSRAHMRDRMSIRGEGGDDEFNLGGDENQFRRSRSPKPSSRPATAAGGDDDLRRAIEESKRTAAAEQDKSGHMTAEERDIQEALRLSKEEEERRAKLARDSTEAALFDDHNQLPASNGFPLVDASLQPQYQGLQPQMTNLQPQFTSFNPYQQQAQQEAMQQQWMQQQAEWMRQQQEQQAQLQQQQQQEEWLRQQQQQQFLLQQQQQQQQHHQQQQQFQTPSPLQVQPTGFASNNPFAPSTTPSAFSPSSPSSLQPPQASSFNNFNLPGTFENKNNNAPPFRSTPSPAAQPPLSQSPLSGGSTPARGPTKADQTHSHLANLIGNADDGVDTFGNFGQLRYGGQAIGTQQTGTNPFAQQQHQNSEQPFFSI